MVRPASGRRSCAAARRRVVRLARMGAPSPANRAIIGATVRCCGENFPEIRMTRWLHAAMAASLVLLCSTAGADEGMWTFHGFPFEKVNKTLNTNLDQAWLDRVRAAT